MRQDWVLRGFRQFDAPVSLVLTYDVLARQRVSSVALFDADRGCGAGLEPTS